MSFGSSAHWQVSMSFAPVKVQHERVVLVPEILPEHGKLLFGLP
jgi:hypothetical protein